uniref:hypothetical protein n=1 Tax=Polynucleobacter sp. TaxID=2029855 RepID=UPI0040478777
MTILIQLPGNLPQQLRQLHRTLTQAVHFFFGNAFFDPAGSITNGFNPRLQYRR